MSQLDMVLDYLYTNYTDSDVERLAKTKIIGALIIESDVSPIASKEVIDKVALFNGIKKKAEVSND